mmetsp:Transcript_53352/g.80930  ORF Transcript_53352/g.80930 Transcript_53352/m.80930 type:complete len:151 (+) Transcript_53352:627-1079(+)
MVKVTMSYPKSQQPNQHLRVTTAVPKGLVALEVTKSIAQPQITCLGSSPVRVFRLWFWWCLGVCIVSCVGRVTKSQQWKHKMKGSGSRMDSHLFDSSKSQPIFLPHHQKNMICYVAMSGTKEKSMVCKVPCPHSPKMSPLLAKVLRTCCN